MIDALIVNGIRETKVGYHHFKYYSMCAVHVHIYNHKISAVYQASEHASCFVTILTFPAWPMSRRRYDLAKLIRLRRITKELHHSGGQFRMVVDVWYNLFSLSFGP